MSRIFSGLMKDLKADKTSLWILGIGFIMILVLGLGMIIVTWNLFFKPSSSPTNAQDSSLLFTQAVETVFSQLTQQAQVHTATQLNTQTPSSEVFPTPSPTLFLTEQETTPSFTPTLTPSLSFTPLPPSPTRIVPSLTPAPLACNRAQFVRDVTVMDDTVFAPNTAFIKTWRIKNIGSCTWTQDYSLVFVSGNALGAKQSVALPAKVAPDQTIDISISMTSPTNKGTHRGDWMLSSSNGVRFGIGSNGTGTLYVSILVKDLTNPSLVYDFAANYCQAKWQSGAGVLPCPGTSSGNDGFVTLLDEPKLENRQEDELALWIHPQPIENGWISGTFPSLTIKSGYHFISWIGCLGDSKGCNVTFRLDILNTKNGQLKNLGSWQEVYDGKITTLDLDLSQHDEKTVQFIMTIDVSGGDPARANAFWFVPGIIQSSTASATPSPTTTATSTPSPTSTWTPTPSPTPTSTATSIYTQLEIVVLALDTLANNLGIDRSDLGIILVREVEWSDTCLELPEEDEICATLLTPGFRIIATYDRTIYEIRTNQDGSNIRWEIIEFNIQ